MKPIFSAIFAWVILILAHMSASGQQKLDSLIVPDYQKTEYTYDEAGTLASRIHCGYDPATGGWTASHKYSYLFDSRGNQTSEIFWLWNAYGEDWEPWSRTDLKYDARQHNTEKVSLMWNARTSEWDNSAKYTYKYDIRGNMTQEERSGWQSDNQEWVIYLQYQYANTYDPSGNLTRWVHSKWNDQYGVWVPNSRIDSEFDSSGHKTRETTYRPTNVPNGWEENLKTEFEFNTAGQLERETHFERADAPALWKLSRKNEYAYDTAGNLIEVVIYLYWGKWTESSKTELRYSESFFYADLIMPPVLYGSSINMLTDILTYSWDNENNSWSLGSESHLYYSEFQSSAITTTDMPHLLIYPNPASDYIHIDFSGMPADGDIEMRDPLGRLVLKEKLTRGRVSIQQIPEGVYFYALRSNGMQYSGKVCKGK